ncbi:probable helicase CHR10 isoform X1 [Cucurbita pepo subsp. pepo]|uniref:probable helicase CHR10 isoform X1 n=1 Tax=Cucurbita pepo subsp. pepo TaxID=3664 RepID=UPI000C9D83D1|nr:probable helicase CHR10 isoform X1 [Cucurbita pepo subsp. pepo]
MNYERRLKAAAKLILLHDSESDNSPKSCPDVGVTATLKPYQVEGVLWLIRRYHLGVNAILGDEMGLGKTLQAISFLSYLKVHQISPGPFLVLCPLSVTDGWVSEIVRFAPHLNVLQYVGDKETRRNSRRRIFEHATSQSVTDVMLPFDVLLTTYDIALIDQDFLSQIAWQYAVIDEAQRLKNPSSVLYNVLKERFLIPRRLLMTGTPIQNNLSELWALLHFCMPSVFGTLDQFISTFKEAGDLTSGHGKIHGNGQFKSLKYILSAFLLRRTKAKLSESGVLLLPPLTEITVMVPLVNLQRKVYMSILRKELPKLLALSSGSSNHQSLQNVVMQLRKACSHPYLFPGIEPEPYEEGEHLVQASGKLVILDQVLQKLHESGHRVLLFAQMTHTLDILQDFLELRNFSYERLDGSIRAEERFAAIRSFSLNCSGSSQTTRNDAFVFLISTRAGGVGLNLVSADTVIFYEQDWNPQVDKQALQRAHRIGQINHVLSINLVTAQTIEEVIMRRAERKLQLSKNVIGEDYIDEEAEEIAGNETGDLRSIIFGLHIFDQGQMDNEKSGEFEASNVSAMAEKVVAVRHKKVSNKDDASFLVNTMTLSNGCDLPIQEGTISVNFDPGVDEASYRSWIEKFKEASQSGANQIMELENRKTLSRDKSLKLEDVKKKAEEKKLAKWEALGYHSLSVEDPILPLDSDLISDSGSVHFVYGDCTHPSRNCISEPTIIFSCVDDSGSWGHGGMFDALAKLSDSIPSAYERASEFRDLHLGDLHLIKLEDNKEQSDKAPQWVALGVVQSYNPRRKVPRSKISLPDLENCILKASSAASQHSASIHMPRIGYQDGSDRSEWYTVERLLRKYASIYSIKIHVYYYRRTS